MGTTVLIPTSELSGAGYPEPPLLGHLPSWVLHIFQQLEETLQ